MVRKMACIIVELTLEVAEQRLCEVKILRAGWKRSHGLPPRHNKAAEWMLQCRVLRDDVGGDFSDVRAFAFLLYRELPHEV